MPVFINPYNFVPFPKEVKREDREKVYRGADKLLSGWIDVTAELKTPLIIPDGVHVNQDGSYNFYRLKNKEGIDMPVIPGSSLRGALRSVYEAASGSCVPFLLSDKKMSRRVPLYAVLKKRGLLGYDKAADKWILYKASSVREKIKYDRSENAWFYKNGKKVPSTGTYVENKGYVQWNVPVSLSNYSMAYLKKSVQDDKDELAFEWNSGSNEAYRKLKSVLERDGVKGNHANPNAANAKALLKKLENVKETGEGLVPVYYFKVTRTTGGVNTDMIYLSNSACGRIAQQRKWKDIMGKKAPCEDVNKLCPACMLFGTINGKGMKGHVRFSDGVFNSGEAKYTKHLLQILGEPRTSAFEFYLEKPTPKSTFWSFDFYGERRMKDGREYTEYFDLAEAMPRGRKMYWHGPVWPDAAEKNQMNSIVHSLDEGSFSYKIYFDEISQKQLDELVWTINFGNNTDSSNMWHKLGHAKPLGYGSVKMTVNGITKRVINLENGNLCMAFEEEKAADKTECPFKDNPEIIQTLLIMCDAKSVEGKEIRYPMAKDKKGRAAIYTWFSNNRINSKNLKVLPKPLEINDTQLALNGDWLGCESAAKRTDNNIQSSAAETKAKDNLIVRIKLTEVSADTKNAGRFVGKFKHNGKNGIVFNVPAGKKSGQEVEAKIFKDEKVILADCRFKK